MGELGLHIDDLVERPGGVLLISVEVNPAVRNRPKVGFAVFDAGECKALRAALLKARAKRQKRAACAQKARQKASEPSMCRSLRGDISRFEYDHERNKR